MAGFKDVQAEAATHEEGAVIPILKQNGEPFLAPDGTPCTVTVLGSQAARVRKARDATVQGLVKRGKLKWNAEEQRANEITVAAAAVIDWHGWERDGVLVPCTPEYVKELLAYPDILQQVAEGVRDHADFLSAPSGTSTTP